MEASVVLIWVKLCKILGYLLAIVGCLFFSLAWVVAWLRSDVIQASPFAMIALMGITISIVGILVIVVSLDLLCRKE